MLLKQSFTCTVRRSCFFGWWPVVIEDENDVCHN
jgi:hypothetical protein